MTKLITLIALLLITSTAYAGFTNKQTITCRPAGNGSTICTYN